MPISEEYGGHGTQVAANMKKEYGDQWKRVFFATRNKRRAQQGVPRPDGASVLRSMQRFKR